ncbi:MAG: hypothetical protein QOJ09_1536 [Actinomycetota bacterium]|nr:hypothetical protein [Actinomycetota bacterium]
MSVKDKLAGAIVGAVAAGGIVGAGWAWAQEAPPPTTPPTTSAPSTGDGSTTPAPDGQRHCDHDGGSGSTDAPTDAPSSSSQTNL